MSNDLAVRDHDLALATVKDQRLSEAIEAALATNDLSKLSTHDRVQWYNHRCRVAGFDPSTRPFQFISLQGKLTLYATKEAGELLNGKHGISHQILERSTVDGVHIVRVKARTAAGRETEDIGVIPVQGLRGGDLANALMKTVTKAKRRATLSLCGLGDVLDETELDTVQATTCDETGKQPPPQNNSGFGRGQYASPEQTESYLASLRGYLAKRNAQWLDHVAVTWGDYDGAKDLCNEWQADNHLVKWAKETGRIDAASCDEKGVKNRQIGRYTAIIYHRSKADQRALAKELEHYLDQQAERQAEKIRTARNESAEATDDEIDAELDKIAAAHGETVDDDAWPEGRE